MQQLKNKERVFKWYEIKSGIFPDDNEIVQFDDKNNILHLGRYMKKDEYGRENVFVTTEGAFFQSHQVTAWIPAPHNKSAAHLADGIHNHIRKALQSRDRQIVMWMTLCRAMLQEMDAAELVSPIQEQARTMLNSDTNVQVSDTTEAK